LPEVPGGTQPQRWQQVLHALRHILGRPDLLHRYEQLAPQSGHNQCNSIETGVIYTKILYTGTDEN
jgi:hypothetical protein